jgi:mono/diheme cytochrome c family protein
MAMLFVELALANSPTAQTGPGSSSLLLDLGSNDYRTYCAACHGVGGEGDGTVAEFLTIEAADLTRLSRRNGGIFPRERIEQVIDGRAEVKVHGPRDMPVWGDWFNAEAVTPDMDADSREQVVTARINALIGYIETLQVK